MRTIADGLEMVTKGGLHSGDAGRSKPVSVLPGERIEGPEGDVSGRPTAVQIPQSFERVLEPGAAKTGATEEQALGRGLPLGGQRLQGCFKLLVGVVGPTTELALVLVGLLSYSSAIRRTMAAK
jgi:hypothetical protein